MKNLKICTLFALLLVAGITASAENFDSFYPMGQPLDSVKAAQNPPKEYHVQIAFNGGYAFRTARFSNDISSDYKAYLKKLMQGFDYGASIRFNIKNGITLGLHYDQFSSSNSAYVYTYDDEGNYYEGPISNVHSITFIGVSLGALTANSQNGRHMLNVEALAGYLGYKDGVEEFGYKYTLSGKTMGLGLGLGYDFRITQHVAIGAEASYYIGALSKVTYDDGTHTEVIDLGNSKEGLQRFNIKAGIRFYL
jgi:hypothetical protein